MSTGVLRRRYRFDFGAAEPLESRLLLSFNPTADEQLMLELLNHLRMFPAENLALMTTSLGAQARSGDADTDAALRFFRTSGTVLAQQWAALTPVPPLAWSQDLYEAAEFHSQQMILADQQTHQAPGEPDLGQRAANAGYTNFTTLGENVYAFARSIFHGHAGFALDWGDTDTGIQQPPGHRDSMMNASFREVGIRVLREDSSTTDVGPLVITQDFGARFNSGGAYLLGVVTSDSDGDRMYDVGEGLGGVSVTLVGAAGTFSTTSMSSGGYQVQAPPGVYEVTFAGGAFGGAVTYRGVSIGTQNVKLDAIRGVTPPAPEIEVAGPWSESSLGVPIASGDTTPALADGTNFGRVNIATTLTRVFSIRNAGDFDLGIAGSPRITITGADAAAFVLETDAAGTVTPGGFTTFAIRYQPRGVESVTATVTIRSDDADEGTFTFRISARGVRAPVISVTGSSTNVPRPIADGDTSPVFNDGTGYSTINIVNQTRTRTYTIRNTGSADLVLTAINGSFVTITGPHAGDFLLLTQPASVVAPGQSTSFRVRFNPSAVGTRDAGVRIDSNAAGAARRYEFALRGVGVRAPLVQVRGNNLAIGSAAAPTLATGADFDTVIAGSDVVVRTFTLRNNGSADLRLPTQKRSRISISGVDAAAFAVGVQPRVQLLRPGASTTFRIRFVPASVGEYAARVQINTLNAGAIGFNIAGTGV